MSTRWIAALGLAGFVVAACDNGETRTPRPAPTPTYALTGEVPGMVATGIAGASPVESGDQAERLVTFRVLQIDRELMEISSERGIVETFPEVGIPRLRQLIIINPSFSGFNLTQEPESYPQPDFGEDETMTATLGNFQGDLWIKGDQIAFVFHTGASTEDGIPIVAVASSEGMSLVEFEGVVAALTFRDT